MNKTGTIILVIVIVILVVAGIWYGASKKTSAPESKEPIKIGAIQPLTGKTSYVGEWVSNGINLAVDALKTQGKKIEIIYEDDSCEPAKAVSAIEKLINIDRVKFVIITCSSSVLAAAPIAEESKVLLFSTVATASKISNAGDYVFRNRESDLVHGATMAGFSYNNLNARKAGVLFLNLDNGIGFKESFKKKFIELGGEVVIEESAEAKDTDFRSQLTKIKNADIDVLYFAGQRMEEAIVQARELGINQKILGPSTMENSTLIEIAGNFAEGIIYTYPDTGSELAQSQSYQVQYKNKYGENSEAYAANSYDALNIIVKAIDECSNDAECVKEYLYHTKEYHGVSGIFGFDENGDVIRRLILKTVKDGQFVPYEE